MKRITKCGKNASLKVATGAFIIIEAGAIVYNVTSGGYLPTMAVDPVGAAVRAAPMALTVGAMLATWSYLSCHRGKWW